MLQQLFLDGCTVRLDQVVLAKSASVSLTLPAGGGFYGLMIASVWSPRPLNGQQLHVVASDGSAAVVDAVASRPGLRHERAVHFVGVHMSAAFKSRCQGR